MMIFNGNNVIEIASFLDTPEIEKFTVNKSGELEMEYSDDVILKMSVGDIITLDENNSIQIIKG